MVADVSTRWNSTYFMLQRALKLWECIKIFCERNNITEKYDLQPEEWLKIQQLCDFLEPLNQETDTISPEKRVTLVLAAPVYIWLIDNLILVSEDACCIGKCLISDIVLPSNKSLNLGMKSKSSFQQLKQCSAN